MRYTVHGSFEDPNKTRKCFIRFSSPDFPTRQQAEEELELWKRTRTYTFQWIEEKITK